MHSYPKIKFIVVNNSKICRVQRVASTEPSSQPTVGSKPKHLDIYLSKCIFFPRKYNLLFLRWSIFCMIGRYLPFYRNIKLHKNFINPNFIQIIISLSGQMKLHLETYLLSSIPSQQIHHLRAKLSLLVILWVQLYH